MVAHQTVGCHLDIAVGWPLRVVRGEKNLNSCRVHPEKYFE
jgi:hypothetical protein